MDFLFDYLLKIIAYAFNATTRWVRGRGSEKWSFAKAVVTAPPKNSSGLGCPRVEFVYSYRFKGELYTGLHEEPFWLADSAADYAERFGEGRSLVVRVKPGSPEVTVVCEDDQGSLTQLQIEQLTL